MPKQKPKGRVLTKGLELRADQLRKAREDLEFIRESGSKIQIASAVKTEAKAFREYNRQKKEFESRVMGGRARRVRV